MPFKESEEGKYHLSESEADSNTPESVSEKLKSLQEQLAVFKRRIIRNAR